MGNSKGQLSTLVLQSLDEESVDLARRAFHSRSSFFRLFQAVLEEPPGAMRRRFLLERAAWELRSSQLPVTEIAFNAQYASLEAFARAFRRAFGHSPSLFRRAGMGSVYLPAPNHFHFCPPSSLLKGDRGPMDLFEVFAGTEAWHTRMLLQESGKLSDEQLDRPVNNTARMFGWDEPDGNLREMLERIIVLKEIWCAALTGAPVMPPVTGHPPEQRTAAALLERFEKVEVDFTKVFSEVRSRGAWDETFVDALCEPPETFTYGSVFGHIVSYNAYRRMGAQDAFSRLGIPLQGTGCPIEYQQSLDRLKSCRA